MKAKFFVFSIVLFILLQHNSYAKEEELLKADNTEQIEIINSKLDTIANTQKLLLENLNNHSIDIIKEIGLPVLLSIIAGIIFWIIFQVIPTINRRKKIRPKIEKDLINISNTMIHMVQLSLLHNENPVSYFHDEIASGKLTKELINIGLYNKALNQHHLVGPFSNNIVIGELIFKHTKKIEERIERIYYFNDQLSVDEIFILDEIYQLIKMYHFENFNKEYYNRIGNQKFAAKNPTLSYLTDFFFNIYVLRQRLDEILATSKSNDINFLYKKILFLKRDKNYKTAIKLIKKHLSQHPNDSNSLKWHLFSVQYFYNKKQSLDTLEKLVDKDTILVSFRSFLTETIKDEDVYKILMDKSSDEKFKYLISVMQQENQAKAHLISFNTALKNIIDT